MHPKLFIPGPIEVEDEVLEVLSQPVQAHYGPEWVAVHNETIGLLRQLFATAGRVLMLPGSGSLAADAAVQSVFAPGQRVLLGINGFFGQRWLEILQANGIIPVVIEVEPDHPLPVDTFERMLRADRSLAGIVAVHLETSTALLNPVKQLAAVARAHDRLIVVDAVSSLGGTPLPMDEWSVDVCVSGSQKCLGGVAGLGLVALNERAWSAVESQPDRPRSWYLDLRRWQWYVDNWSDWHPFPITMPCSVVLALRVALRSLLAEGLPNRLAHYAELAQYLRNGLHRLGLRLFVPESLMAPVLTAAYCPDGVTSGQMIDYLAREHQMKITAGFGRFRDQVIRIGHMGNAIDEGDVADLLGAIETFMLTHPVP